MSKFDFTSPAPGRPKADEIPSGDRAPHPATEGPSFQQVLDAYLGN
jgi:hypothetical protein